MGKKKPFIDKKKASVYHVVRRSQRDVGTEATAETLSDFVLMPSPDNERKKEMALRNDSDNGNITNTSTQIIKKKVVDFNTLKSQITNLGLADEQSSTFTKYTKPIDQSGTFLPSNILHSEDATNLSTLFTDTSKNDMDTALQEAMEVHEVGRQLDSIALNADCMEEDMAHALFDFEEGEFEEILDDFCFTANQDVLDDEDDGAGGEGSGGDGGGKFNYEQHIQMLMEKARQQENGGGEVGRSIDHDVFEGVTPLHGRIEEDDEEDDFDYDQYGQEEEEDEDSLDREFNGEEETEYDAVHPSSSTAAAAINDEEQRILCQKFEETLLEYDSDDMGDLDEECEEIVGDRPLEGDVQLEAALDEFLTEKQDDILIEGTTNKHDKVKRTGGSGYSALVGKTMVNASGLQHIDPNYDESKSLLINIEESKRQMKQDLAEADAILANPEMDLPPEEVFIDGKSYFTETSRSQWDCESILSTYSNLDNNPVVIGRKKKKKKKKKRVSKDGGVDAIPEEGPVKIQLSNKTGLPLGTFDNQYSSQQSPENDVYDEYDNEYYNESDTYISINRGEARNKAETKMEKKQRKVAIKEERKICRMQKKIMKEAFKEEFIKRGQDVVVNDVGGSSVFRFS